MINTIRIAVIGYGNVGKFAVDAVKQASDMELVGVVDQASSIKGINVVNSIKDLKKVDVALICIPSRAMPQYAREVLSLGINTVDSYDIHAKIADFRKDLQAVAEQNRAVAVVSAGWDPGTDSMVRCMFEFMAPSGITYTNFGPGMSMGHSVAVKSIDGVKDALAMTIPAGAGIHRRIVYVELDQGTDFAAVENAVKTDPYFIKDETHVFQVDNVNDLKDMGHGVVMERKGVSGITHNQQLKLAMTINNPALTAQIMVAAARASLKQRPGAYTLIQIPIIDFIYGDTDEIIKKLV
ncbi:MAG: diaminopimelate dehydrogenase [Syntrophomonadaceae bacterium]|nr:diaminopimelate dehydrogenase [Syntrophomonadaceae bacterium]MDD4549272.1 diaminopimelate dehydrogenase [Syntrophomonadaceae bacterium]